MYIYIMCMYYVSGSRARVAKKKGGRAKTLVCVSSLLPRWVSFRAAIVVLTIFVALKDGPGFAWALGATTRRAEPQPPALPSLKQERR